MLLTLALDWLVSSSVGCWLLEFLVVWWLEWLELEIEVSLFSFSLVLFNDDWVVSNSLLSLLCVWDAYCSFVDELSTCWLSFDFESSVFDGWATSSDCEVTSFCPS